MYRVLNWMQPSHFFLRGFRFVILLLIAVATMLTQENRRSIHSAQQIRDILDDLSARLSMQQNVQAMIVPHNERIVSVEHPATLQNDGLFVLSFDERFLDQLTDEDLTACIAHELGHVWIFTHHPYLQTEELANDVAMRVVSRESLSRVYTKLWSHLGTEGNLADLLRPQKPSQ
jgi:hypothetical protein